jgi:hypothetical protein
VECDKNHAEGFVDEKITDGGYRVETEKSSINRREPLKNAIECTDRDRPIDTRVPILG